MCEPLSLDIAHCLTDEEWEAQVARDGEGGLQLAAPRVAHVHRVGAVRDLVVVVDVVVVVVVVVVVLLLILFLLLSFMLMLLYRQHQRLICGSL